MLRTAWIGTSSVPENGGEAIAAIRGPLRINVLAPLPANRGHVRRKILASLTVLAFLVGVGVASWIWHGHHTPRYFAEVEPGLLYRSGQPDGSQLSSVVKRYGIKTIINLRIPDRMTSDPRAVEEREAGAALGVRLVNIPSSQSPSPEILRQFFEIVDDLSSRPVLLHCPPARSGRAPLSPSTGSIGAVGPTSRRRKRPLGPS